MKPNAFLRRFLAITGSAALIVSYAHSATLYWDGATPAGDPNGGAGTWDTSTANWDTAITGGSAATWNNSNPDLAVFGGTAGAVTTGAAITTGGLWFNTTGYTITATSPNSLSFSGTSNIIFNNIAAATITGTVGGSGNVSLSTSNPGQTAGTLTLNGTSTGGWSGTTTINAAMTLALAASNQALLNTSGITLNGGGITLTNTTAGEALLNRVNNGAGITSNGGTITFTNTSGTTVYAETIGSVDLARGQLNLVETTNQAGTGSQTLTLSGLTRTGGANTSAITFSSASGLNTTKNMMVVTGATATTAGQIIGPWATVGTAAATQTDYAVYNASSQVIAANIAATAENSGSWVSGANVTLSAATNLTASRTVNSLRYTGGAGSLDLGASNFGLQTNGILNGGSGTLTISTNGSGLIGTGGLTTPTGGGNLYLTAGSAAITVSAPINDNGGAVTVVKSGGGTLTLSSTTSNFSGGVVLNAGTLGTTSDAHLGIGGGITVNGAATWSMDIGGSTLLTYNRSLTVNDGAVLTLSSNNNGKTITGVLSGNGAIINTATTGINFSNIGNTFTGTVNNGYTMNFASLGDSSNPVNLINSNSVFDWTGGAKTFASRPFNIQATGTGVIQNSGTGALVIQQPLGITGAAGARTLTLQGSNTGANVFSGIIADGTSGGASVVSLSKAGTGTWTVSGNNTFTGSVTAGGGTLVLSGVNQYTGATAFVGNATLVINSIKDFGVASSIGKPASGSITVDRYGAPATTILSYVGTGDSSNRTFQFDGYNISDGPGLSILNNGTGALVFTAGTFNTFGSTASRIVTMNLGGTYTGGVNEIQGIIQNYSSGASDRLAVTKNGPGIWQLSGNNTYTGTTTVNGGILRINGTHSGTGAFSISAGGTLGGTGSVAGAVTTAVGTTAGNGGAINLTNATAGQSMSFGGTLTFSGTTANPTYLYFDLGAGATGTDKIVLTTASALPTAAGGVRSVQINLNPLGAASPGTYTVIQGGAGATFSATNYALATTRAGGNLYTLGTSSNLLQVTVAAGTAGDATAFWTGATSTSWGAANWQLNVAGGGAASPGYATDVTFSSTTPTATNLTTVLNGDYEIRSLTFTTPGTGGVSITGATNTLTINNSAGITTNNSSGTNTISSKIGLGASQTWTVATGGTLSASGGVYDFGGGYNLTKSGGGTLAISAAANWTGTTTINGGTFDVSAIVGGANAITPLATSSIAFATANSTFKAAASGTALVSYPTMSIASGVTATFDKGSGGNNTAYSITSLTGSGTFALTNTGGSGTNVTFGTTAGFTGNFDFNNTAGNAINTPDLTDAASSKIRMSSGLNSQTPSFNYTGSAAVTLDNRQFELYGTTANTLFAINNNGTGLFTVNTDLLVSATGTKTLTLGGTNTLANTFGGVIGNGSGLINLTKSGTGTWVLTNTNSYTGATTISASGGILQLGNGGTTGALTGTASISIGTSANLTINRSNTFTQLTDLNNKIISGAGSLTQSGTGGVTLSLANTFSGATTITPGAGALTLTNNLALQNSALTFQDASQLVLSGITTPTIGGLNSGGNVNLGSVSGYSNVTSLTLNPQTGVTATFNGIVPDGSGAMNLVKSGAGIQVLAGLVSYTGTTTISGGVLQMSQRTISGGTITLNADNVAFYSSGGVAAGAAGVLQATISNNIALSSSVTSTGASIYTAGAGRWNFTGNITGGATSGSQTLKFDSRAGGTNGGDRTSTLFSGVISNGSGGGILNLSLNITPQSSSSATNQHPTNASLSGINTFTGTLSAIRGNTGATSWLTIGGERWTDGGFGVNNPQYGRMGTGYLAGPGNDGIFTSAINFSSTATNIVNLNYFSSANQTFAGVIGGSGANGALVKEGTGTLTLSNANLYNSLTTIGGGTLRLGFGDNGNGITNNILPSGTPLWMGLGTTYAPIVANAHTVMSGGGGGGTLELAGSAGSATQTVASLTTAANTTSSIVLGTNRTLTITSGTIQAGASHSGGAIVTGGISGLNFNTSAGGADASTSTIGTSIVQFGAAVTGLTNGFTVTDSTGFGLATTNGSNQVIRNTSTAALPTSGGASPTNYQTTSSTGNSVTSSQSAGSITVDSTGGNVTLTLAGGVTLSNNVWNFGGVGSNTSQVTGGTGVNSVASGNTISINNFNTGSVTFNTPILANGTNALIVGGSGTVTLAGVNTFTGATTINSGNLQIGGSGQLQSGTYAGAIAINGGSVLQYSSSAAQTLSGVISGPGGITKDTSSTSDLTLSGANIYTGNTTASAGRIVATAVTNLSSGGTNLVQSGTGQFYLNAAATFINTLNLSSTGYTEIGDSQNNAMAVRMANGGALANTITLSGASRIGLIGNGSAAITGKITGSFGIDFYGVSQANNGNQTFIISNTGNNYTGNTTITSSLFNNTGYTGVSTTLRLGASNVIPNGASAGNVVFAINGTNPNNSVILDLAGFNETINGVTVNSGANAIITNSVSGASLLQIGDNNTTSSFAGSITDGGVGKTVAITKIGSGTLTLSSSNTYTGATTVTAGTLAVNGSLANTTTTVQNGGTLQGNGTIGGSVTIQLGGTLATGNSIESLGTGTLNLNAGSTFAYEIDSGAASTVAGDLTYVTGDLNLAALAGSLLTITELGTPGAWSVGDKLTLISYTGSWNNELFTYLGGTLADDSNFTLDGVQWTFNYNDTLEGTNYTGDSVGSFVTMTVVVPEPGAAFIGSLGLLALLRRRRN